MWSQCGCRRNDSLREKIDEVTSAKVDREVIGNEKVCAQNRLAYICNVKGLSEGAGAKMDNNVPLAPGCDSGHLMQQGVELLNNVVGQWERQERPTRLCLSYDPRQTSCFFRFDDDCRLLWRLEAGGGVSRAREVGHVTSCCRRGVTTFACFLPKLGMVKTACAFLTWRRMCSSAHFACRDCSDARGWGLACKNIICSFGKISDAGRRISGKHNTNWLWKLLQEKGTVNHGLLVISCSERVHISEVVWGYPDQK